MTKEICQDEEVDFQARGGRVRRIKTALEAATARQKFANTNRPMGVHGCDDRDCPRRGIARILAESLNVFWRRTSSSAQSRPPIPWMIKEIRRKN